MAKIRPFKALRPIPELAEKIAALPYDVMDTNEARAEVVKNPLSFLRVTKSETLLDGDVDSYSEVVYQKAKENLQAYIDKGQLIMDNQPCFYIYRQKMGTHEQVGLVAASSVEEYRTGKIKKHELTRTDKEDDRVNHVKCTAAQTGAVFLSYKNSTSIDEHIAKIMSNSKPVYDFTADDGIAHTFYVVDDANDIMCIQEAFAKLDCMYIADGHHRSAAAMRTADFARDSNPNHTGEEEYNYFLTVIFPDNVMQILDYNRAVHDLCGYSEELFLKKVEEKFTVQKLDVLAKPLKLHEFTMYLGKSWYKLTAKEGTYDENSMIGSLDVSILQDNLLQPVLAIGDPRKDKRIQFIGGIRGLEELQKLVDSKKAAVAFALYPTSMKELMGIADAGEIMPPKSTWFEPKLRDAMAIHIIEEEFLKRGLL